MHAEAQIQTLLHDYVAGYLCADSKLIATVFHPETKLLSVSEGKLEQISMENWIQNLDDRKRKNDIRVAQAEIVRVDISGNAATATVTLTFSQYQFTDFLSLLNIENRWIIVGKIYNIRKLT